MPGAPPRLSTPRVQEHRARKQSGAGLARCEISYDEITALIDLGLLAWDEQDDSEAIGNALRAAAARLVTGD